MTLTRMPVFIAGCLAWSAAGVGASWAQPSGFDARSRAAPALPAPVPASSGARTYLLTARAAVLAGRTGQAQEALERAETRLLDRPTLAPDEPDTARVVRNITTARQALDGRDRRAVVVAIDDALAAPPPVALLPALTVARSVTSTTSLAVAPAPTVDVIPVQAREPSVTYALLPGHWHLDGADWIWISPDTEPRLVQNSTLVPGQFVWQAGAYAWVPEHRQVATGDD